MKTFIKKFVEKFVTREIITYLIAGVLTTLVNFLVFHLFSDRMAINASISNIVAWIIAVIFAYVINNYWVFKMENEGAAREAVKFSKFVLARIFTFIVEEAGVFLFIDQKTLLFKNPDAFCYREEMIYKWIIKLALAVIVTILNYVFSKLMIFTKNKKAQAVKEDKNEKQD